MKPLVFAGLALAVVGCSEEAPYRENLPAVDAGVVASGSSSAKPTSLPKPSASASSAASALAPATSSSADVARGPVKWADYPGPFDKITLKGGETAWCVLPVSVGWGTLEFSVRQVARVDGTWLVVKKGEDEFLLPPAFVQVAAPPTSLAKGDAVLVSAHETGLYGRVIEAGEKPKVRFRFGSSVEELEVDKSTLIKLDGRLAFGAPVLVQEELEDTKKPAPVHAASFVSSGSGSTWVLLGGGKPEHYTPSWVHALNVVGPRKAGDKVWLIRQDDVAPGVVQEVLDDDLRYKIKLDNGSETTATYEAVTSPVAGTRASP
ncbi:MAG: hypothetical protein U0414_44480 [Polyangiaceae bacterium]